MRKKKRRRGERRKIKLLQQYWQAATVANSEPFSEFLGRYGQYFAALFAIWNGAYIPVGYWFSPSWPIYNVLASILNHAQVPS